MSHKHGDGSHCQDRRLWCMEKEIDLLRAKLSAAEKERDEWHRLSGMDCDGMNCPPSVALKAELATAQAALQRLVDLAKAHGFANEYEMTELLKEPQ